MKKTDKLIKRCLWVPEGNLLYQKYHDREWGVPVYRDRKIFEFLVLESAQAGLSWLTVLRKRKNYKKAFFNFDPKKVAKLKASDLKRLMNNPGIIRNRLKIEATISNAKHFLEVKSEFGTFSKYIWGFVGGKPICNRRQKVSDIPAKTQKAEEISKALKERGFKFMGPTIIYAHMQATGMVNDHITNCFRYKDLVKLI